MNNAELIETLRHCGKEGGCLDCQFLREPSDACYQLSADAADLIEAQQKALDECAKQLADMAAQLPKDGEWNIRETASGDVEAKCPKCGFEMLVNQPGNGLLMVSELLYCPRCGSRMAKGEQE